jgi:hypothetical protein
LYEKEEVKIALVFSLLNKKEDDALFWAYELFYSGWEMEWIHLVWTIYYDFFAILNASLEKYLFNKIKIFLEKKDETIVALLVKNFILRPYSTDAFFLRILVPSLPLSLSEKKGKEKGEGKGEGKGERKGEGKGEGKGKEKEEKGKREKSIEKTLVSLLEKNDLSQLSLYLLQEVEESQRVEIMNPLIAWFVAKGVSLDAKKYVKEMQTMMKKNTAYTRIIWLTRILYLFARWQNHTQGKNVYAHVDHEDILAFETIVADPEKKLPAYKILPLGALLSIDEGNYLSLFSLKRDTCNITQHYRDTWLYCASFSPLWLQRIESHGGKANHENKKIEFDQEDYEDAFYEEYQYEPDEQKKTVQEKTIQPIKSERTWLSLYQEYKKNRVVDLDETVLQTMKHPHSVFL